MAYGHAERNLALIRQLEAETRQLLARLPQPDQDEPAWPEPDRQDPQAPALACSHRWGPQPATLTSSRR